MGILKWVYAISAIIIIVGLVLLAIQFVNWLMTLDTHKGAKMKFFEWLELYKSNPHKWGCYSCGPAKYMCSSYDIDIVFSFFGFLCYRQWYKKKEKEKEADCWKRNLDKVYETLGKENRVRKVKTSECVFQELTPKELELLRESRQPIYRVPPQVDSPEFLEQTKVLEDGAIIWCVSSERFVRKKEKD